MTRQSALKFDLGEGERLRDEGIERAETARLIILVAAKRIAIEIALRREDRKCWSDLVYAGLEAEGYDVRLLGNAAGAMFKGDQWVTSGERLKSRRTTNHSRWIFVWRLR